MPLIKNLTQFAVGLLLFFASHASAQAPRNHLPSEVLPQGLAGLQLGELWNLSNIRDLKQFIGCTESKPELMNLHFNQGCDFQLLDTATFLGVPLKESVVVLLKDNAVVYIRVRVSRGPETAPTSEKLEAALEATGLVVLAKDSRGSVFTHKNTKREIDKRYLDASEFLRQEPMISFTPEGRRDLAITFAFFGASALVDQAFE